MRLPTSLGLRTAVGALLFVAADDHEWTTTWGSMPQLTEPANLPPAPFVSSKSIVTRESERGGSFMFPAF
jgi:hypothetical protein